MKRNQYQKSIQQRIITASDGDVFIPSDFFDIAEPTTINKILERLVGKGILRKVRRGLYDKPLFSTNLQEYEAPQIEKIAFALARNYGWNIVPTGETALNFLGLSNQVVAHWIYLSDGPYREYDIGNVRIQFKHAANKNISGLSYRSALVVQALLSLGNGVVQDTTILTHMAHILSDSEKKMLLKESQYTTAWVFEAIRRICL